VRVINAPWHFHFEISARAATPTSPAHSAAQYAAVKAIGTEAAMLAVLVGILSRIGFAPARLLNACN